MTKRIKKKVPKKASGKSVSKKVRLPGAEDYLKELKKSKEGPGHGFSFFDQSSQAVNFEEFFSTGSIGLDRAIGGGWPIGGMSELTGYEHVGKSTLLDQSVAECQRQGGIALLIDSEHGRSKEYTQLLGVNTKDLIIAEVETMEDVFEAADAALNTQAEKAKELKGKKKKDYDKPPPLLIVWDALGGTPTRAELEGKPDADHVAVAARRVKMNFRRLTQRLYSLRAAFVFSNHLYQTIGHFATTRSYGGSGVRMHPHVRATISRVGSVKIGTKIIGHDIKALLKKNRVQKPVDPVFLCLTFGLGFDNSYTLFKWGLKADVVPGQKWILKGEKENKDWFWVYAPGVEPVPFHKGFLKLGEVLAEKPELYQTMVNAYNAYEEDG